MGETNRSILSALRLLFGLLITVALGRQLLLVLVFPVVYLIYTMVRGGMLGWYPYPFLNSADVGTHGVTVYAIRIGVTFVMVGWSLLAVGNKLGGTAAAYD